MFKHPARANHDMTRNPDAVLRAYCAHYPTRKQAATSLGMSPSYLADLLRGRRTYSEAVLAKLGLERRIVRRKKAEVTP